MYQQFGIILLFGFVCSLLVRQFVKLNFSDSYLNLVNFKPSQKQICLKLIFPEFVKISRTVILCGGDGSKCSVYKDIDLTTSYVINKGTSLSKNIKKQSFQNVVNQNFLLFKRGFLKAAYSRIPSLKVNKALLKLSTLGIRFSHKILLSLLSLCYTSGFTYRTVRLALHFQGVKKDYFIYFNVLKAEVFFTHG